ncbi:unnamed protein product [Paramecium sonneborni]|uniref:Uncharacterized protein n=1 Tax=Paramecium sonneborni TaxID=65129 RepID=A0A8S1LNU8_9CILI|nr:unnamed protein product [Paramecium sonneborni]
MEICELFKETLKEEDDNKRQAMMFYVCRKLGRILPFPSIVTILQQNPNILKYLLIASQLDDNSALMMFQALQERYYDEKLFVKLYFDCVIKCLINQEIYSQKVIKNEGKLRSFLFENSKYLINKIEETFINEENICVIINNFFKGYIKYNPNFDMLNQCFQYALEKRSVWKMLREIDQQFEMDVENQLILLSQAMSTKNLDFQIQNCKNKNIEQKYFGLSKTEMKQQILEEWLFQPSEVPLLVANHPSQDQLQNDVFKSNKMLDILLSFMLYPTKYSQITQNKLQNIYVDLQYPDPPSFRQLNIKISQDDRPAIQFRAFRTMQALTDNRNIFLLTKINQGYYQRAYSMIHECLKQDLVAIIICPEIIVQYLTFLLYSEPQISTFYLISYHLPFRLMLFLDIPEISQYFTQFMSFIQSPYYKFDSQQTILLWKYFELTNFFSDLLETTLFDQKLLDNIISKKSTELYKPSKIEELQKKPDFSPLEIEKQFIQPEHKKVTEEIDQLNQDFDQIFEYLSNKRQKTKKLFERMLYQATQKANIKYQDNTNIKNYFPQPIQTVKNLKAQGIESINFSPTKRKTIVAPKLVQLLDNNSRYSMQQSDKEYQTQHISSNNTSRSQLQALTNPNNLLGVINESIQNQTNKPLQDFKSKPIYQRILVKRPTQTIMLYSQYQQKSIKRLSQQSSSLVNININDSLNKSKLQNSFILNKFNHLVGNIKSNESEREFNIYPPELKDQQISDLETLAIDQQFQQLCQQNENYTKGVLQCIYDLLLMIFTPKKFILSNNLYFQKPEYYLNIILGGDDQQKFIQIIAKNYLLKQKFGEEYQSTSLIAGRIYNLLHNQTLDKYIYFNYQEHLILIVKILVTQLLSQSLSARVIILLESLALILEKTKEKLLQLISISFWHLLIESCQIHYENSFFMNFFTRILTITFIYGNLVIFQRILLKINFLSYFIQNPLLIRSLFLIIFLNFKLKQDEIKKIKQQIFQMSSWNFFYTHFQSDIKLLESQEYKNILKYIKTDDFLYIESLIENKYVKKHKILTH